MKLFTPRSTKPISPSQSFIDLVIFLGVMFGMRTFDLEFLGFWGNALSKTIVTVGVAWALLAYRRQSWQDLGLFRPKSILKIFIVAALILVGTVLSIMFFEIFFRDMFPENSGSEGLSTETLTGSTILTTLLFVWVESFLEELQDRGFSLNRFESLFSFLPIATVLGVICQAMIFGFRHSYDFSPRSVTTGLIGLVFGTIYVLTGRNMWPLILAHILLNTMSILEKL